jgi:hypothetical protein
LPDFLNRIQRCLRILEHLKAGSFQHTFCASAPVAVRCNFRLDHF